MGFVCNIKKTSVKIAFVLFFSYSVEIVVVVV